MSEKMRLDHQTKTSMGEGEKYNFYVPTMVNNYISNPNNNPTKQYKRVGSNGWVNLKKNNVSIYNINVCALLARDLLLLPA